MPTKSLDLGCGNAPKNHFGADEVHGIDMCNYPEWNVVKADLAVEGIPFPDDYFDYVTAHDFLEHIPRLIYAPARRYSFVEIMNEIWRVLKPDGKLYSFTPAYPLPTAFVDPTHVNFITQDTFRLYFDDVNTWGRTYGFKGRFHIESQEWTSHHLISVLVKM
jgi:SAM-dependent methyltransferase